MPHCPGRVQNVQVYPGRLAREINFLLGSGAAQSTGITYFHWDANLTIQISTGVHPGRMTRNIFIGVQPGQLKLEIVIGVKT